MPEISTYKIAVSGDLGSGKSTVCKLLQTLISFDLFSMGEAWRKIAEKYQMTILELNKYSETHPLDEEMDQTMIAMGSTPQNTIFDSRLAWHFIPHAFKVHLIVDNTIAAARIFNDQRGKAEGYSSLEETRQKLQLRKESENRRYFQKYGLDCGQFDNYDLIVDTSYAAPDAIARFIAAKFGSWSAGECPNKIWLSPKSIFPTKTENEAEIFGAQPAPAFADPSLTHDLDDESQPLPIILVDGVYYLLGETPEENRQAHQKMSAALFTGVDFLPVRLWFTHPETNSALAASQNTRDARDYLRRNLDMDLIQRWEKHHQFKFAQYPAPV
ncbi:MAG: AAA family ATPase [Firmicutes bacterium]|nr:AAA family ATPase [Bacillota bacterium]